MLSNKLRKWILKWLFGYELDFVAESMSLLRKSNKLIMDIHRDYSEISDDQIAILRAASSATDIADFQRTVLGILIKTQNRALERKAYEAEETSELI